MPNSNPSELMSKPTSKDFQIIGDEHADPHKSEELKGEENASMLKKKFIIIKRSAENYQMHIFWLAIYTMVLLSIFAERAYCETKSFLEFNFLRSTRFYFPDYSVEREHAGLRQIAGYGVTLTRGAASAMMFTYSTLLITMCRNTITYMRETWLHRVIPFDSAVEMHKFIAIWAIFFTGKSKYVLLIFSPKNGILFKLFTALAMESTSTTLRRRPQTT